MDYFISTYSRLVLRTDFDGNIYKKNAKLKLGFEGVCIYMKINILNLVLRERAFLVFMKIYLSNFNPIF